LEGRVLFLQLAFGLWLLPPTVVVFVGGAEYFINGRHQNSALILYWVARVVLAEADEVVDEDIDRGQWPF
jgi:hypothetical protein